jgi:hypothetical protein
MRLARRSLTPEAQRQLVRAMVASAAAGCVIYVLVTLVVFPLLQARLTSRQVEWLGRAFDRHPGVLLGAIAVVAAVLALPVLGVFRWVYGPWRRP